MRREVTAHRERTDVRDNDGGTENSVSIRLYINESRVQIQVAFVWICVDVRLGSADLLSQ
jgi:hypothetical protein